MTLFAATVLAAFTPEMLSVWATAIAAAIAVVTAAVVKATPVIREVLDLIRQSADAVGAGKDVTSVTTQVKELAEEMRVHFGQADARLVTLEKRVSLLSCQACTVDAEDEPTPPAATLPTGQA